MGQKQDTDDGNETRYEALRLIAASEDNSSSCVVNLSPALRRLDAQDARDALREEALDCLEEWFADNTVRVQYLQVRGLVT